MALTTDNQKCAHLLRRFGLGASEAEVTYYCADGLNGAIDRLLAYSNVDEGFPVTLEDFANQKNGSIPIQGVVTWWGMRLIMTRRPLQEKMTLFWHNHFATSANKVSGSLMMFAQNETLRRNATGSFRTMLMEIAKDPAMIYWLDNQENVKGHANENFAREVMELFTLGIGHYSETDIQEGARAFTGYTIQRLAPNKAPNKRTQAQFAFRAARHDEGEKSFLGSRGYFTGDDIINILLDQPRTSEFITKKLWEWFAYQNPDPQLVQRLAKVFRDSNLDIGTLLKAMMKSSEFYSVKAERAIVKNPADFCVSTLRQLGVGEQMRDMIANAPADGSFPRQAAGPAAAAMQSMKSMGMALLYPPDVAGWPSGNAWISTATMVERMTWGDRIFGQAKAARFPMRYPAIGLFASDPTPKGVVNKLVSVFDAQLKPERLSVLVKAAERASTGGLGPNNANATSAIVAKLIFATPEFQFS